MSDARWWHASAPATRPLVACISYYDLNLARTKGTWSWHGSWIRSTVLRAERPNLLIMTIRRTSYNQANDENRRTDAHTKHLAHTRYQIPP